MKGGKDMEKRTTCNSAEDVIAFVENTSKKIKQRATEVDAAIELLKHGSTVILKMLEYDKLDVRAAQTVILHWFQSYTAVYDELRALIDGRISRPYHTNKRTFDQNNTFLIDSIAGLKKEKKRLYNNIPGAKAKGSGQTAAIILELENLGNSLTSSMHGKDCYREMQDCLKNLQDKVGPYFKGKVKLKTDDGSFKVEYPTVGQQVDGYGVAFRFLNDLKWTTIVTIRPTEMQRSNNEDLLKIIFPLNSPAAGDFQTYLQEHENATKDACTRVENERMIVPRTSSASSDQVAAAATEVDGVGASFDDEAAADDDDDDDSDDGAEFESEGICNKRKRSQVAKKKGGKSGKTRRRTSALTFANLTGSDRLMDLINCKKPTLEDIIEQDTGKEIQVDSETPQRALVALSKIAWNSAFQDEQIENLLLKFIFSEFRAEALSKYDDRWAAYIINLCDLLLERVATSGMDVFMAESKKMHSLSQVDFVPDENSPVARDLQMLAWKEEADKKIAAEVKKKAYGCKKNLSRSVWDCARRVMFFIVYINKSCTSRDHVHELLNKRVCESEHFQEFEEAVTLATDRQIDALFVSAGLFVKEFRTRPEPRAEATEHEVGLVRKYYEQHFDMSMVHTVVSPTGHKSRVDNRDSEFAISSYMKGGISSSRVEELYGDKKAEDEVGVAQQSNNAVVHIEGNTAVASSSARQTTILDVGDATGRGSNNDGTGRKRVMWAQPDNNERLIVPGLSEVQYVSSILEFDSFYVNIQSNWIIKLFTTTNRVAECIEFLNSSQAGVSFKDFKGFLKDKAWFKVFRRADSDVNFESLSGFASYTQELTTGKASSADRQSSNVLEPLRLVANARVEGKSLDVYEFSERSTLALTTNLRGLTNAEDFGALIASTVQVANAGPIPCFQSDTVLKVLGSDRNNVGVAGKTYFPLRTTPVIEEIANTAIDTIFRKVFHQCMEGIRKYPTYAEKRGSSNTCEGRSDKYAHGSRAVHVFQEQLENSLEIISKLQEDLLRMSYHA